jgi:hypothetical protein
MLQRFAQLAKVLKGLRPIFFGPYTLWRTWGPSRTGDVVREIKLRINQRIKSAGAEARSFLDVDGPTKQAAEKHLFLAFKTDSIGLH